MSITGNESFHPAPSVWHPLDAAEAWRLKQSFGDEAAFIAGGTWLSVQWENGAAKPRHLIDLSSIPGMKGISVSSKEMKIGALSTLTTLRRDPFLGEHYKGVVDAVTTIAAPSIRNAATIGGNIACKTGDILPALIVSDAELLWQDGRGAQREPLVQWLESGIDSATPQGRILTQVKLQLPDANPLMRRLEVYQKIGRREAFTPSVVTVAYSIAMDRGSGAIGRIRMAVGGGQMIPHRLYGAEKLLLNSIMSAELMEKLYEQVVLEAQPKGDSFVSAAYRKRTAAGLLSALLWQQFQHAGRTASSE
ncbi:FAD binding domain-containing protein [Paenibacillus lignilyticus]|uniref:FAD binding domain-containing protein n=1 Tax=Paenibacillus lignilyticus TaxID=1172615 RepID=A0ABS5CBG4_9BACL|nr:FAD binding domain-containing protein [Paenibacillus lignilyticus]MBP3963331.1 FAD binding domain-containing protein [Paenibacillus lignilyticus]